MSEGWHAATLGDLLQPIKQRAGEHGPTLVLSVTEKRGIIPQTEVFKKRIATKDLSKYKVLRPFDLAFNPYLVWAGAVGQWLGAEPGVVSPVYECFRVVEECSPRFVGLVLESGILTAYFEATAVGSIQRRRRTTVPVFNAAPVQLPPIDEQRRIVDLVAAIELVQTLSNRVAEEAATARSRLTARWFASSDDEIVDLSEIATVSQGSALPSDLQGANTGDIPWFKIADMGQPANRFGYVSAETTVSQDDLSVRGGRVLPAGTITFPRVGGAVKTERKRILSVPAACDENHLAVVPGESVLPGFVLAFFENLRLGDLARSGAVPSLNQGLIRSLRIPVPPVQAQEELVQVLDALRSTQQAAEAHHTQAAVARRALLHDLLTGARKIPDSYDELLMAAS